MSNSNFHSVCPTRLFFSSARFSSLSIFPLPIFGWLEVYICAQSGELSRSGKMLHGMRVCSLVQNLLSALLKFAAPLVVQLLLFCNCSRSVRLPVLLLSVISASRGIPHLLPVVAWLLVNTKWLLTGGISPSTYRVLCELC